MYIDPKRYPVRLGQLTYTLKKGKRKKKLETKNKDFYICIYEHIFQSAKSGANAHKTEKRVK